MYMYIYINMSTRSQTGLSDRYDVRTLYMHARIAWKIMSGLFQTGMDPVAPRSEVWCLTSELLQSFLQSSDLCLELCDVT